MIQTMVNKEQDKSAKILVVDDEESMREICQDALQEEGYQVLEAEDGEIALQRLSSQTDIDLVITDLSMPQVDGLELLRRISEQELDVDVLITTGYASIETAVECIKKGAADYLPKPFNINHLLVKVGKVVQDRASRQERSRLSNIVRMLNASNALNARLDLKSICYEFVLQVQKNFASDSVVLFLQQDEESSLVKQVVRGRVLREDPGLFSRVRTLAERAVQEGKTFLVDKNNAHQYFQISGEKFDYSVVVVPLYSQIVHVGSAALIRKGESSFTQEEAQLLGVFAAQAATSIQNARMYTSMRDKNLEIIRSYAKAVEAKDYYTKGHSERVAVYGIKLGSRLKLHSQEIDDLYTAGILHDIGKIGIPDHILNKPSSLTDKEFEVMRSHPGIAREILGQMWSLKDILPLVYHHHEQVDGKGYPAGLQDGQIPFLAKVISVVDAFEAMTSDRAYRKALSWEQTRDVLLEGAGKQWDKDLVEEWVKLVSQEGFENLRQDIHSTPLTVKKGNY